MAVTLDPEQAVRWTSDLERFEVVSGRPGEVGSVARLHYREGGRAHVRQDTLLEAEPLRVSGQRRGAEGAGGDDLARQPDGSTRVAVCWTGEGKPLLLPFLLPLMRRSIERQAQADLAKLKRPVEAKSRGEVAPPTT
jgi:hypothetical protein